MSLNWSSLEESFNLPLDNRGGFSIPKINRNWTNLDNTRIGANTMLISKSVNQDPDIFKNPNYNVFTSPNTYHNQPQLINNLSINRKEKPKSRPLDYFQNQNQVNYYVENNFNNKKQKEINDNSYIITPSNDNHQNLASIIINKNKNSIISEQSYQKVDDNVNIANLSIKENIGNPKNNQYPLPYDNRKSSILLPNIEPNLKINDLPKQFNSKYYFTSNLNKPVKQTHNDTTNLEDANWLFFLLIFIGTIFLLSCNKVH